MLDAASFAVTAFSVPPVCVVAPAYVLALEASVSVPPPLKASEPAPEIALLNVTALDVLTVTGNPPLLNRLVPVPIESDPVLTSTVEKLPDAAPPCVTSRFNLIGKRGRIDEGAVGAASLEHNRIAGDDKWRARIECDRAERIVGCDEIVHGRGIRRALEDQIFT